MPKSQNGLLYFTDEQLTFAQHEVSTLEYVKKNNYPLSKKGRYYVHAEHDSLVFSPNGTWYWNSRNMHGDALDFITQFEHHTFVEAVLLLNGENILLTQPQQQQPSAAAPDFRKQEPEDKAEFALPKKAASFSRLFGYLCKGRALDSALVSQLVGEHKIYLSAIETKTGKTINNVVFVSLDEKGEAKSAYQRGIWQAPGREPFKAEIPGSDKESYPFQIDGTKLGSVIVYEGAIDAISHATLEIEDSGRETALEPYRIALGGCFATPLMSFLGRHPEVKHITLALDNDDGGRKGIAAATEALTSAGYTDISVLVPRGKDWNEDLVARHPQLPYEPKQAVAQNASEFSPLPSDELSEIPF